MSKELRLQDCTKEELIAWIGSPRAIGAKEACLRFISDRRFGMLTQSIDEALEKSQAEVEKYVYTIKQANDEINFDRKMELFLEAERHWELSRQYERDYERLNKRQEEMLGI